MEQEKLAFPLTWPIGYKRTSSRINSKFKTTMERAQQFLHKEISRLGGYGLIVSTNIPIRSDGMLYANWMSKKIDDPGVAIFFKYNKKDITMCCDQYRTIWENVYALAKGIEAIRGMERWGVSEFLERAFTGFTQLPPPVQSNCWDVLDMKETKDIDLIKRQYFVRAKSAHPDTGGSAEKFNKLTEAYQQAITFAKS